MTDDFDEVFGGRKRVMTPAPNFAGRLGRSEPPQTTGEPVELTVGSTGYKPYGYFPSAVGETCDVRGWMDGTDIPKGSVFQYRFLMDVAYVGAEEIRLFFPTGIIVIEGQRLNDLRDKLARRQVTFIQQFNPKVWPMYDRSEPLIERVGIVRPVDR